MYLLSLAYRLIILTLAKARGVSFVHEGNAPISEPHIRRAVDLIDKDLSDIARLGERSFKGEGK